MHEKGAIRAEAQETGGGGATIGGGMMRGSVGRRRQWIARANGAWIMSDRCGKEHSEAPIPSTKLTKGGHDDDDDSLLPLYNNNQPTMVCQVNAAWDGEAGGKGGGGGGG